MYLIKSNKDNSMYYNQPIELNFKTKRKIEFQEKPKGTYLVFYNTENDFNPEGNHKYDQKSVWFRVRSSSAVEVIDLGGEKIDPVPTPKSEKYKKDNLKEPLQNSFPKTPSSSVLNFESDPEDLITPQILETEDEANDRIKKKFSLQDSFLDGVSRGIIKALIVSGPAGVGKSHKIKEKLKAAEETHGFTSLFIKGVANPLFIYKVLYEHRSPKNVVVFDDCDGIFKDHQALNIFKGALDSSKNRTITWGVAKSNILEANDIPTEFDFQGSIVFITNLKLKSTRSDELKEHLKALESRCHYLDLALDTEEDVMRRIKQVVLEEKMLEELELQSSQITEILNFIDENKRNLRELSLRTVVKIVDLIRLYPNSDKWKELVVETCFKKKN